MTWDCQVQDVGELSLINYVISCRLKWLGQSTDTSGDKAAPDIQYIPYQWGKTLSDGAGRRGYRKARTQEKSAYYVLQDNYLPWQTRNKKASKTRQKPDSENQLPNVMQDEEQGPMGARGSVIQAQDPALPSSSPHRKLYFLPSKEDKL